LKKLFTILLAIILTLVLCVTAGATYVNTYPKFKAWDTNANPLVGGKVHSYQVGTSTRKNTYSNAACTVPNTNPVILDSLGEANIYISGSVHLIVKDSNDVTLFTIAEAAGGILWTFSPSSAGVLYSSVVYGGSQTILQAAITAVGGSEATLYLAPANWLIVSDMSIPANITLKPERGAILAITTTKTLTINGTLDAGLYQIFSCIGTGKVDLYTNKAIKEVYPQWWGAKADGVTDYSVQVQAAITTGMPVRITGYFVATVTITTEDSIVGVGVYTSRLTKVSATGTVGTPLVNLNIIDTAVDSLQLIYVNYSNFLKISSTGSVIVTDHGGAISLTSCNFNKFDVLDIKDSSGNGFFMTKSCNNVINVGSIVGAGVVVPNSCFYLYEDSLRNTINVGHISGTANTEYGLQLLHECNENKISVGVIENCLRGTSAEGCNLFGCDNNDIDIGIIRYTAIGSLELSGGSSRNRISVGQCLNYDQSGTGGISGVGIFSEKGTWGPNWSNDGYSRNNTLNIGYIDGSSGVLIHVNKGGGEDLITRGNRITAGCGSSVGGSATVAIAYSPDTYIDIVSQNNIPVEAAITTSPGTVIRMNGKIKYQIPRASMLDNPSFETDAADWAVAGGSAVTRRTDVAKFGAGYGRCVPGVQFKGITSTAITIKPSTTYKMNCWIRGSSATVSAAFIGNVSGLAAVTGMVPTATFARYTGSWTSGATDTTVQVFFYTNDAAPGATYFDIDGIMFEENTVYANYPEERSGKFLLSSGTETRVYNSILLAGSSVILQANGAAGTVLTPYISSQYQGTSFVITHAAAAGTEAFSYWFE